MAGLTTIRSAGGVPFTVASEYAPRFQSLIDGLEAAGYPLQANQSGGYNPRMIAGTNVPSQHAFGRAIDVNWNDNPRGGTQAAIPADLAQNLANQYGFTWGGTWKNPDPMHFEVNPNWQQPSQAGASPMMLGGPQPAPLQPQPDNKPMPTPGGILSAPQTPDDSEYAQQLKGILGGLGSNSGWQALTALGAGLAGNSTRGWGAGIGAGVQNANQVMQGNMGQRMSLLEALANEHARQQQLALSQAQMQQSANIANRPKWGVIAKTDTGREIYGPIDQISGRPLNVDTGKPMTTEELNSAVNGEGGGVVKLTADAIQNGDQPPVFTNLGRNGLPAAVKAELERRGVNVSNLQQQWDAAHKQILSLNGPQMVRYAGLSNSVINTIDEVNNLAKEMDNSGLTPYNAAKLSALVHTAGNTDKGQLAAKYLAATNTLKEEFANLAQGGFAPTEAAWGLANQQINGNYGVKELQASLQEVQRLLRYRLQGIPNMQTLGPGAANQYIGNGQGQGAGVGLGGQPGAAPQAPAASPQAAPPQPPVPPAAVDFLRKNKSKTVIDQFNAKYGPGAAEQILGAK